MPNPDILSATICRELKKVGLFGKDFTIKKLEEGGALNTSYCLIDSDNRYFLKTFESDVIAGLDRQGLFDIQSNLAQSGRASKPLYLSQACDFQIEQWIDQPTLDKSQGSMQDKVKHLAWVLADIHRLSLEAPNLDLPRQWQHYHKQLKTTLPPQQNFDFQVYGDYWDACCAEEVVFCHNDLSLKHVTVGELPVIFDWEYCAVASPYFDLASCIEVNQLSDSLSHVLTQTYAQHCEKELCDVQNKVTKMMPLVNLTSGLWFQAAQVSRRNIHQVDG